ncbi:MAG: guanylate kinase [Chloroflexi bacterium]|nr:guanylate kinase [Chloroflexota bacterium]
MPRRVSPATDSPRSGLLFLVTAPSGAGKDSVIGVLRDRGADLTFAITALTREPREGERDGIDHFFLPDAEFEQRLRRGWFLETASVYGRRYGTPIHQVREPLLAGRDVMLRLDVQGARELKRRYPGAIAIFVEPPSPEEAERRMRSRATESPMEIERRIAAMRDYELSFADEADFRVVNTTGDLGQAAGRVWEIVTSVRRTPERMAVAADLTPVPPPD